MSSSARSSSARSSSRLRRPRPPPRNPLYRFIVHRLHTHSHSHLHSNPHSHSHPSHPTSSTHAHNPASSSSSTTAASSSAAGVSSHTLDISDPAPASSSRPSRKAPSHSHGRFEPPRLLKEVDQSHASHMKTKSKSLSLSSASDATRFVSKRARRKMKKDKEKEKETVHAFVQHAPSQSQPVSPRRGARREEDVGHEPGHGPGPGNEEELCFEKQFVTEENEHVNQHVDEHVDQVLPLATVGLETPPPDKLTDLAAGGDVAFQTLVRKLEVVARDRGEWAVNDTLKGTATAKRRATSVDETRMAFMHTQDRNVEGVNAKGKGNGNHHHHYHHHHHHHHQSLFWLFSSQRRLKMMQQQQLMEDGEDSGKHVIKTPPISRNSLQPVGSVVNLPGLRRRFSRVSLLPGAAAGKHQPRLDHHHNSQQTQGVEGEEMHGEQEREEELQQQQQPTVQTGRYVTPLQQQPEDVNVVQGGGGDGQKVEVVNENLRQRVEQLEVTVVENDSLRQQVKQLEWALDVVRDDAERVRMDAWTVLAEREKQEAELRARAAPGANGPQYDEQEQDEQGMYEQYQGEQEEEEVEDEEYYQHCHASRVNEENELMRAREDEVEEERRAQEMAMVADEGGHMGCSSSRPASKMPSPTCVRDAATAAAGSSSSGGY